MASGSEMVHAARRLVRSPAFTLASIVTLALAIGANASIFAVVQRVVVNPLPYPDSDRLITLEHGSERLNLPANLGVKPGLYFHYTERARTLERAAIYTTEDLTLTGDDQPERIRVTRATASLAATLGVSPAIGRWFIEQEDTPGAPEVAVLSHGLWMRRYNADPRIVGRLVTLGGVTAEVIGVMPASYAFPEQRVDAWVPVHLARSMGFGLWDYQSVARMRPTATVAEVRAEMNSLIADTPRAFPGDPIADSNTTGINLYSTATTLKEKTVGGVTRALWILLASVGLVLLVACANVANLFLVRSEARQREVAVRRALGATRADLARFFLSESVLLTSAGTMVGLAMAWGAVQLLVASGPASLPRVGEIRLDGIAVAFTFVLSACTVIAFAAIPLLHGAPLGLTLRESGRNNTASRVRHRARHVLMGAQIAFALVLVIASGLMLRSFQALRAVDPGFDASSTLTFNIGLPEGDYGTRDAAVAAHHAILDRISALPGVAAVSTTTCLPLSTGCYDNALRVEGRVLPAGTLLPLAMFRGVAGGYFEAMRMPVLRGRGIGRRDVERREPIVVINRALADSLFPNEDPIGARVASNRPPARPGQPPSLAWLEVVGIVANTPTFALAEANPVGQIFMPMSIAGGPAIPESTLAGPNVAGMSYVVRSSTTAATLLPSLRKSIDAIDPNLAIAQVRTLQEMLEQASAQMAFTMVLIAIAALVALTLGMIGIYGAMSYIVTLRTSEIGLRLALGASPAGVAGLIVRQGGVVALAGVAVGLAAAVGGTRLIESLLYGVSARDPFIFAATVVLLLAVALAACWLPARRAARLSPIEALRAE
jgi:putative ABC transport system permease protein